MSGMVESGTRSPDNNPRPELATIPVSPFINNNADLFEHPPQLTPSAQITYGAPFARSTDAASGSDRFWVRMFAPGHVARWPLATRN